MNPIIYEGRFYDDGHFENQICYHLDKESALDYIEAREQDLCEKGGGLSRTNTMGFSGRDEENDIDLTIRLVTPEKGCGMGLVTLTREEGKGIQADIRWCHGQKDVKEQLKKHFSYLGRPATCSLSNMNDNPRHWIQQGAMFVCIETDRRTGIEKPVKWRVIHYLDAKNPRPDLTVNEDWSNIPFFHTRFSTKGAL